MQISQILQGKGGDIVSAKPDDKLGTVVSTLAERRIGALLVSDSDGILGIISERDIVSAVAADGAGALEKPVSSYMTEDVKTCTSSDRVSTILGMMTGGRFRHVPVVDGGELTGIISIGDIVKARLDEQAREADALRDYIQTG